jgi:hypothetical protein
MKKKNERREWGLVSQDRAIEERWCTCLRRSREISKVKKTKRKREGRIKWRLKTNGRWSSDTVITVPQTPRTLQRLDRNPSPLNPTFSMGLPAYMLRWQQSIRTQLQLTQPKTLPIKTLCPSSLHRPPQWTLPPSNTPSGIKYNMSPHNPAKLRFPPSAHFPEWCGRCFSVVERVILWRPVGIQLSVTSAGKWAILVTTDPYVVLTRRPCPSPRQLGFHPCGHQSRSLMSYSKELTIILNLICQATDESPLLVTLTGQSNTL